MQTKELYKIATWLTLDSEHSISLLKIIINEYDLSNNTLKSNIKTMIGFYKKNKSLFHRSNNPLHSNSEFERKISKLPLDIRTSLYLYTNLNMNIDEISFILSLNHNKTKKLLISGRSHLYIKKDDD